MTRWTAKQKDKKLNLYQLRSDYSLILKKEVWVQTTNSVIFRVQPIQCA